MTRALVVDDRSTRPLSDLARHVVIPEGIVDSVWFDLDDRFREWGIGFDRWQDDAGQLLLGTREDGKYAATVGGCSLAIPRQVAKTFLVSRTVFALCSSQDDQTWLWTAHRNRTSTQTFQKLAGFAQRKAVKRFLQDDRSDGMRTTNGEQEFRFRNGSRMLFGARENGFGRGFDEVDGEVFDESQILTEFALDDMIPATNQSRNPHGALLIFMGTPPGRSKPSEVEKGKVFTGRRRDALEGKPVDVVKYVHGESLFIEFSADSNVGEPGGPKLDDDAQLRKANPSYPHRTPPESIARMRKNLGSDDAWKREALGVWGIDDGGSGVVDMARWGKHLGALTPTSGAVILSVDTSLDRQSSAVVAVGAGSDNVPQVSVVKAKAGTGWVPELIAKVCAEHPEVEAVVLDERGSSAPLVPAIEDALEAEALSVRVMTARYPDLCEACAITFDLIHEGKLRHAGDPQLDAAVRGAQKRESEGAFVWSRRKGGATVAPLVAMTLALWEWQRSDYDVMESIG